MAKNSFMRGVQAGLARDTPAFGGTQRTPATPRAFQAFGECPDTRCRVPAYHLLGEPEIFPEDVQLAPHFLIPAGTYIPRECQHCGWTWRERQTWDTAHPDPTV